MGSLKWQCIANVIFSSLGVKRRVKQLRYTLELMSIIPSGRIFCRYYRKQCQPLNSPDDVPAAFAELVHERFTLESSAHHYLFFRPVRTDQLNGQSSAIIGSPARFLYHASDVTILTTMRCVHFGCSTWY